jgi:endoglucanase
MTKLAEKAHPGRFAALHLNGPWLAFFALFTACGSDTPLPTDPECPTALSGCECVADATNCAVAPDGGRAADGASAVAPSPDTGVASEPSPIVGARDAGSDASVRDAGPMDGGNGLTDAASADSGQAQDASSSRADAASEAGIPNGSVGFVAQHGALRVKGNRVVDTHGQPIQLRGMSLFWSQWSEFYVAKNVDVLVDDWKATVIRAALGVENEGGYLVSPDANLAKVRTIVDRAIARGQYVIVDWHDHNAQNHVAQATAFFQTMANSYGKQPNVIFEIFNEPLNIGWPAVKSYAEPMIRTIRAAGSQNLIIVGTPNWSQDVDVAANDRITSDDNVAYTLHFYANTHRQPLRDKAKAALDKGLALFVTEWGTCSADGNGTIDEGETRTWLSFLQTNGISWANWSLNDKAEACSAVQPAGGSVGPWRNDQLTPSGVLVKGAIP